MSLLDLHAREPNLSDEDLVTRFFLNINAWPEKKDFFVRDFEEFYFKIRPRFTAKLIKTLIEVS
jgi:hypothetical protein